jgi:carbamoyl-phosphate synthase large subunit
MPKRSDISSILIIGAGPIVIGQACEFDYSGAQACKALKQEGYRIVLVNSNPATIMTDPELADATYIEPITPAMVEKIIARERPDALLPTMGGQTALNTAMKLAQTGVLSRWGVELIGAREAAIAKAEDRLLFREAMDRIGLASPKSRLVESVEAGQDALAEIGLPAIIRPSFTLGGTGGGIAYNTEEFEEIVRGGLRASPAHQVLVEESVLGWKEYELEVVRDRADNCIIVCSIENIDPMGVHTGDSVTVAPALTLTDKEYQLMRNAAIAVLREIGVDTGGSNVQFAVNPADGRLVIIEMNPRVSRSSALASKATGFPIAKVAAKLAVGYTLDELDNEITRVTPASFEPTIDYIVTKMPRFTFEKFPGTEPLLTTSMKSVGEAMAIGRSFAESVQKALRSMETGLDGFDEVTIDGAETGKEAITAALAKPSPDRLLLIEIDFMIVV